MDHVSQDLLRRGFSRRQIGRVLGLISAGAALPFYNEFAMAQDAERRMTRGRRGFDPDVVRLTQNENPMGPCKEGLEAIAKVAPQGWRYSPSGEAEDLMQTISSMEDVPASHISLFAGSSDPLHRASCAFTSPSRSWVMAEPGYGGGAPEFIGSKTVRVPLRADYSHDAEAMIKADPDAGVYYVCNPNNPTGTITARKDIDYLLANKAKDAIVLIDEAYIHWTEKVAPCTDLVTSGKDVMVLRTFSKIYGMAGLRSGFAMARPDLLGRLRSYGSGFLPVTGLACATASLKVKSLVPERRAQLRRVRENTFEFLEKKGVQYIPSEANFFMMEAGRSGQEFGRAMAENKVMIGRVWPVWPTKVRVTIGTQEEMDKFKAAFERVMAG